MKLFSPHDPPDHKPCSPLDYPATLRDVLQSEARIIHAIHEIGSAGGDAARLSAAITEQKAHVEALQKSIDAATP